jgi:large subunit ribosomal protein L35e
LYSNDKHKPLDLRTKGTRAWRRRLSPADAKRKTLKQQVKEAHFPTRKYALKA